MGCSVVSAVKPDDWHALPGTHTVEGQASLWMHRPCCCCCCRRRCHHPWLTRELHFLSLPLQKTSVSQGTHQASRTRLVLLGQPASRTEQPLVLSLSAMKSASAALLHHGSQSNKPPLDIYSFYYFCSSREPLLIE